MPLWQLIWNPDVTYTVVQRDDLAEINPIQIFFCRRPLWRVLAWAGMSILWCCPSSISSANHSVTHPPTCEGWFRRGWHVTCLNHASFCLLTVPRRGFWLWTHKEWRKLVDLVPHHPIVGLVLQVGDAEKFPQALGFESLDSIFQSQWAGSTFHSHRGGWGWQLTCATGTCLCHPCTGMLPSTWNWSPSRLFMLTTALMMFMLLFIILFFSVLTSSSYDCCLSLLVRPWKFTIAATHKIDIVGKS